MFDKADYIAFLRLKGLSAEDDSELLQQKYLQSKKIGKFCRLLDIKRRKEFGPGKFHGSQSATVYLNRKFVKGWGGVNAACP